MSLRYTAEASMDEPALRDIERWKDKIEVRLDNRQVFFLFFGSALCACLLFVLGVIVGKRLESRGRALAPEVQDPLAVLDRINAASAAAGLAAAPAPVEQELTFPKALIGGAPRGPQPRASAPRPLPLAPAPRSSAAVVPASKPAPAPSAPRPVAAPKAAAAAPPVVKAAATAPPAPKVAAAAPPAPKPAPSPPRPMVPAAAAPKPAAPTAPAGASAAASPAGAPAKPGVAPKGKFTLQLSSFPERGEADAMAKRFASLGAYVVASEVPGKGTVYRVRVGNYASSQEALAAKGTFEKQNNVIAYVAGR